MCKYKGLYSGDDYALLRGIADRLIDQRDEPLHASELSRLHYWRDKAISAANEITALSSRGQG